MMKNNNLLTQLAMVEAYAEGPAIDNEGNIYFTILTAGSIMKLDNNGVVSTWGKSAYPNGQIILSGGDHLICDGKLGKVLRFSPDGIFIRDESNETCAGVKVNSPNDLLLDGEGNLFFTDSIRHDGVVFFISSRGEEYAIATGLDFPNGIAISNDGKKLFVAESFKNRIISIDLTQGISSEMNYEVFIDLPLNESGNLVDNLPDGIAINQKGLMAVAHYGMGSVHIVDADGKLISTFDVEMKLTSNVYFLNDETLIVTGGFSEEGQGAVFKLCI